MGFRPSTFSMAKPAQYWPGHTWQAAYDSHERPAWIAIGPLAGNCAPWRPGPSGGALLLSTRSTTLTGSVPWLARSLEKNKNKRKRVDKPRRLSRYLGKRNSAHNLASSNRSLKPEQRYHRPATGTSTSSWPKPVTSATTHLATVHLITKHNKENAAQTERGCATPLAHRHCQLSDIQILCPTDQDHEANRR